MHIRPRVEKEKNEGAGSKRPDALVRSVTVRRVTPARHLVVSLLVEPLVLPRLLPRRRQRRLIFREVQFSAGQFRESRRFCRFFPSLPLALAFPFQVL